jgi:ankyrin repeat protein
LEVKRRVLVALALLAMLIAAGAYYRAERQRLLNGQLTLAARQGDVAGMKRAIARGADVNGRFEYPWPLHNYSYSVLADSVVHDRLKAAEHLLRFGADPNSRGRWSEPVLSIARRRKNAKMVRLLQRHGARE